MGSGLHLQERIIHLMFQYLKKPSVNEMIKLAPLYFHFSVLF